MDRVDGLPLVREAGVHRRFRDSLLLLLGFANCDRVPLSLGSLDEGVAACVAFLLVWVGAGAFVGSVDSLVSAVSLRILMCSSTVLISCLYLS